MSFKKLLGASLWKGLLLSPLLLLLLLAALGVSDAPAGPAAGERRTGYGLHGLRGFRVRGCAASGQGGSGRGRPLPQALTLAVLLYAAVWLIALSGETDFSAHGLLLTAATVRRCACWRVCWDEEGNGSLISGSRRKRARAVPRRKRR